MTEYLYELKVPKDRVAVLIGTGGETKRQIEEATKTKIEVDSAEGDVILKGEDSLALYSTKEIVRAIGRGFNPEYAMLLLKQEYSLEIISLKDFASDQHMARLKGRVIGSAGKTRRTIESLTESFLCVYGKTIGIIGETANVVMARKAVELLLSGSMHASVYKMLERNRSARKKLI